MTEDDMLALMRHIGTEVRSAIEKVSARVSALEAQPSSFKYVGTWESGRDYHEGNFTTCAGSLFHCDRTGTKQRPGTGVDWTLAVKKGTDAR